MKKELDRMSYMCNAHAGQASVLLRKGEKRAMVNVWSGESNGKRPKLAIFVT